MILESFKPIKQGNRVVGLMHLKNNGKWESLSFAAVKSRYCIYLRRQQGQYKDSEAVESALESWKWALSLFEDGQKFLSEQEEVIS